MADVHWPLDLPQVPLVQGYQRKPQSVRVRTSMDSGPAKVRRRFTAKVQKVTYLVTLSKAERLIFWDWYDNTIGGGTLRFNWIDGVTGDPKELRFDDDEPTEAAADGNQPDYYTITMALEIMP